jgi:SecD/SecF fusion protein
VRRFRDDADPNAALIANVAKSLDDPTNAESFFTELDKQATNKDENFHIILAEARSQAKPRALPGETALLEACVEHNQQQISLASYFPKLKYELDADAQVINQISDSVTDSKDAIAVFSETATDKDLAFEAIVTEAKRLVSAEKSDPLKALEDAAVKVNADRRGTDVEDADQLIHGPMNMSKYFPRFAKEKKPNEMTANYVRLKARGKLRLGLDLKGGTEILVAYPLEDLDDLELSASELSDQIIEVLRNRIDASGMVEPELKTVGENTISVKVPSSKEAEVAEIVELIERPAKLTFHLVSKTPEQAAKDPMFMRKTYEDTDRQGNKREEVVYIKRIPEAVKGTQLSNARAEIDNFGQYSVNLWFDAEGRKNFCQVTTDHVNERLAIVLDERVYSAPNLNEPICGGIAQISGGFSAAEAQNLAIVLRCGNMPVEITVQGQFTTAPTLGAASVKSGTNAAVGGLILVIIFMVIYYMTAGIVADLALVANVLLVLGTLTIAGATITLPGIAGIVLTIGMAVDANVLIFERIREELNNGKSIGNAIRNGYDRAFVTILDANITTFLTAAILYKFGSGPVRGFAVTLMIGIAASLFTALFMTRVVFDALLLGDKVKNIKMMQIVKAPTFDFLSRRKIAAIVSAVFIVIGLGNAAMRGNGALSVDFSGGTAVSYHYENADDVDADDLKKVLVATGFTDARVTFKGSATKEAQQVEIVVRPDKDDNRDLKTVIATAISGAHPDLGLGDGSMKEIGSLVGDQFRKQAFMAMFIAIIGIIAYITFRFEFGFAMGAVAALVHDVVIGTGIFLLPIFGDRQLSLPVIAALLTIIGYSLNDTIVVFDRIRENIGLRGKKEKYLDIANSSIRDTLSRTVLTSVTTMIVVLLLLFFGGGAISDFALVMAIGILVGTYSSIFVATPVMLILHDRAEAKKAGSPAPKKKATA